MGRRSVEPHRQHHVCYDAQNQSPDTATRRTLSGLEKEGCKHLSRTIAGVPAATLNHHDPATSMGMERTCSKEDWPISHQGNCGLAPNIQRATREAHGKLALEPTDRKSLTRNGGRWQATADNRDTWKRKCGEWATGEYERGRMKRRGRGQQPALIE